MKNGHPSCIREFGSDSFFALHEKERDENVFEGMHQNPGPCLEIFSRIRSLEKLAYVVTLR